VGPLPGAQIDDLEVDVSGGIIEIRGMYSLKATLPLCPGEICDESGVVAKWDKGSETLTLELPIKTGESQGLNTGDGSHKSESNDTAGANEKMSVKEPVAGITGLSLPVDVLSLATSLKEAGNAHFKASKYNAAVGEYNKDLKM